MKPLPYVDPIKDLDALITLFGDPVKFAGRLREWQTLRDEINKKLAALGEWEHLEALQAEAAAKLAEARDVRLRADEYSRDEQAKAQKVIDEAMTYRQGVMQALSTQQAALESGRKALLAAQQALAARQTTVEARTVELSQLQDKLRIVTEEMEQRKAAYQERLAAIEAAAKGGG